MRKLILLFLSLLAFELETSTASAQSCLGLPSFAGGSVHLNLAAEFPDSARAYAVGIGAGRPDNLFANLGAGQATYEGLDEKSSFGFLEIGGQIPVGSAQFCPIAGASLGAGPDDEDFGLKVTSRAATAGGAMGLPIDAGGLQLIPNVAVKWEYVSIKVDEEDIGSYTDTFSSGIVDLGLGFVFRDRVSLQPLAHIPFGDDTAEMSFGVFASVSFGWRAQ